MVKLLVGFLQRNGGKLEEAEDSGLCVQSPSIIPDFPIGILGQVWYLIVSIPDLCTLTYFKCVFVVYCVLESK